MIRDSWLACKVARLEGLDYAGLDIIRVVLEVTKQLQETADIAHVYSRVGL
jgi:glutathione synthase/RimK-type ligase-like ATP-grasp enzyme